MVLFALSVVVGRAAPDGTPAISAPLRCRVCDCVGTGPAKSVAGQAPWPVTASVSRSPRLPGERVGSPVRATHPF